jgi:large repetitive protein
MMARRDAARALATALLTLALLCLGPVAGAWATPPNLIIEQPQAGSSTDQQLPLFTGTSEDEAEPVTIDIYPGAKAEGMPAGTATSQSPPEGGQWSAAPKQALEQGQYTAVAQQGLAESPPVTFTIDTTPPAVTINPVSSPTNDAMPALTGDIGTAVGDFSRVTVDIYEGTSAAGSHTSEEAEIEGSEWSYTPLSDLPDGTYTAQATQEDEAGNLGKSAAVTFTIDTTPPAVSINPVSSPTTSAAPTLTGAAGTEPGDIGSVGVIVYKGSSTSGTIAASGSAKTEGAAWSYTPGEYLADGTYTAQATQKDAAGNSGTSAAVTFTITATSPVVTIDSSAITQRAGVFYTSATPSFTGTASTAPEDAKTVTVKIHSGTSASGPLVSSTAGALSGSDWSAGPVQALPEGTYTVLAEQQDADTNNPAGASAPVTFTVDAQAPVVTLSSPAGGSSTASSSQALSGTAGTAAGDAAAVTVQLYGGSSVTGAPLEGVSVQVSAGAWSAVLGGLDPGTYTARAEQSDDVGNVGYSAPVTFTVTAPVSTTPTPAAPVASFQVFPSQPHVGEPVSLVSSSTDANSPLTGFAWNVGGVFVPAQATLSTVFSTPGPHVVSLRVTAANGLSSIATQTITAIAPTLTLMQPFPVVRIAGSASYSSARITLLSVQAPIGATVTVTCSGRGCPAKARQTVLASSRRKHHEGVVTISFARFERFLRAGAMLRIRVYGLGQIGKYTTFTIRRGKLPARVDTCLSPAGIRPLACPS